MTITDFFVIFGVVNCREDLMSGTLEQNRKPHPKFIFPRRFFDNPPDFIPVVAEIDLTQIPSSNLNLIVKNIEPFLKSLLKETIEIDRIAFPVEQRELGDYIPAANIDNLREFFNKGFVPGQIEDDRKGYLGLPEVLQIRSLLRLKSIRWNPELASQLYKQIEAVLGKEPENPPHPTFKKAV